MEQMPRVGVGIIIKKDGKVLLGKRLNAHGHGMWSFPGGHLEFWEEIEACAKREVMEEVGITITNLTRSIFTNDRLERDHKHYVTIFIIADWESGEVEVREPDKCERWEWFAWDQFPTPLFSPIIAYRAQAPSPFE